MIMKHIKKMALELEGAWHDYEPFNAHEDGSVSYEDGSGEPCDVCIQESRDQCYNDYYENPVNCYGNNIETQDDHYEYDQLEDMPKLELNELIKNNQVSGDLDCLCDCCRSECDHASDYVDDHYMEDIDCDESSSNYYFAGESDSSPCSSMRDLLNYLTTNYPDEHDSSCGMHMHISFKSKRAYMTLISSHFKDELMDFYYNWLDQNKINENSRAYQRLKNNTYCENTFRKEDVETQLYARDKDSSVRYRVLNYCFSLHNTIELRFLNIFDKKEISLKCVKDIVKFIDSYIETNNRYLHDSDMIIESDKPIIKTKSEIEII